MATRPIFIPKTDLVGVEEKSIEFKWYSGFAPSQKKKSIIELHEVAKQIGIEKVLEISSKSEDALGVSLSAFNLLITTQKHGKKFTVETAFQGSKVFENGGPYRDLFGMDSRAAKKDIRIKESGNLIEFNFFGTIFPLMPLTYFYDWLYINALIKNTELANEVVKFGAFSDIEFNPTKSINCQAHAVALYISLRSKGLIDDALKEPSKFLLHCEEHYKTQGRNIQVQSSII